jgi:5-formyltetrahydrofolate cyclo-ligase
MLFASLPDEFDTMPLIEEALRRGKRVCMPRVDWRARTLGVHPLRDLAALQEGYMGILEPVSREAVPLTKLDFILVPGTAFDGMGNRLGRGAGYYDRLLSTPDLRAVRCGAAFGIQVLDFLPHGPSDQTVDLLVTEQGVFRFGRTEGGRREA